MIGGILGVDQRLWPPSAFTSPPDWVLWKRLVPGAMSVYLFPPVWMRDGYLVWRRPDDIAIFLVNLLDIVDKVSFQ